jgi:nitroreductase
VNWSCAARICAAAGDWPTNEDCCFAARSLTLAAHALGLGTCPTGIARDAPNKPEAKRKLGIHAPCSAVTPSIVGYVCVIPRWRSAASRKRRQLGSVWILLRIKPTHRVQMWPLGGSTRTVTTGARIG